MGARGRRAEPIVRAAVDGGITFFDTADVYTGAQVARTRFVSMQKG